MNLDSLSDLMDKLFDPEWAYDTLCAKHGDQVTESLDDDDVNEIHRDAAEDFSANRRLSDMISFVAAEEIDKWLRTFVASRSLSANPTMASGTTVFLDDCLMFVMMQSSRKTGKER